MAHTSRVVLALLALAAAACGSSAPAASSGAVPVATAAPAASFAERAGAVATADTRPRVVFLGDSLTAGYGLAPEQSVPSLIQARMQEEGYPYEVVNAGVSGDTSAGGLRRLDWALQGDVRVMVLELGANDGLRGLPVSAMRQNLSEIISRALARNITVVFTGMEAPPNYGPAYTSEFRQVFRDLARQYDVVFVPFYLDGVAGIPRLNIADGIHPNPEGARIVEGTIWHALEPVLDKHAR